MNYSTKIMIGGQALRTLGSERHTNDVDYLVFDENNFKDSFIFDKENNIDYMNGNASNFAEAIYNIEKGNEVASPQSLFELKVFATVNQMKSGNLNKVNSNIFDLNFLKLNFDINTDCPTFTKFYPKSELNGVLEMLMK